MDVHTGEFKQRRHSRYAADLVIRVCAVRGTRLEHGTGRMVDVSELGLCFVGPRYLPPGTSVNIEFEDCRLVGEVKHCRLREYAAHVQFVTGVQIQQVLDGQDSWKGLTQASR
jgi:PilZ domain